MNPVPTPKAHLPLDIDLGDRGPRGLYFVVDVFTDTPLEGNQLGVLTDGTGLARADAAPGA